MPPTRRRRLAERRTIVGLSQEQLAAVIGVERTTVARWESADTDPQPAHRPKLAKALGVTVEEVQEILADITTEVAIRQDLPTGQDLRTVREAKGIGLGTLAKKIGRDKGHLSRVERGVDQRDVTHALVRDYERALDVTVAATSEAGLELPEHTGVLREAATYRRDVLTLPMIVAYAANTSRQMALADPDPLTLAEIEDDVDRFSVTYLTIPHSEMLTLVEQRWAQVDRALVGRTSLASRRRLTRAAGQLSYFLSRLAFNCGDYTASRQLAVLAEQYARQIEDSVVLASVAGMRSSIAYYRGRYHAAVSVFEEYPQDPPYLAGRNAAYRARAYGRLGDVAAAKRELERMWRSEADRSPEPGDLPMSGAAKSMFAGWTLAFCGDGERAEAFARSSIAAHEELGSSASREEWAHALLMLAYSLFGRKQPIVDEAAAIAAQAVDVIDEYPTHTVMRRAEDFALVLQPYRAIPAVAALRERIGSAPRLMLIRGSK